MEKILMDELRLYHHPVAITWLFTDKDVEDFRARHDCVVPVKPVTFCQWEIAARMQNKTVLAAKEQLDCSNAQVSFGWKENDDKDIKSQLKYCKDLAQAERFQLSKPCLPPDALKAVGVGPLGKAALPPHVVHFYCDNMQSYQLAVDYMAATETHPLWPQIAMSSAACGGSVFAWREKTFNCCPACSGSYNAGKTERGEVNVFIPGEHIEAVVQRLLDRIGKSGSSSITRPGDPFPGGDICKNCPLIVFTKE
jgi:uncharacterized protein (DUF169 family)